MTYYLVSCIITFNILKMSSELKRRKLLMDLQTGGLVYRTYSYRPVRHRNNEPLAPHTLHTVCKFYIIAKVELKRLTIKNHMIYITIAYY